MTFKIIYIDIKTCRD